MARSHAKLYTSIWDDPDFLVMSPGAQRMYMLLLSQKKLAIVGLLEYKPLRWAKLSPGTTVADVIEALAELEAARFVFVDEDTDELVIRTLVKHDGFVGRNSNLLKGMWSAWTTVESKKLRTVLAKNMPAEVWSDPKCAPLAEAIALRDSTDSPRDPPPSGHAETMVGTDSSDYQSGLDVCGELPAGDDPATGSAYVQVNAVGTDSSDYQSELEVGTVLPPSSYLLPPSSAAASFLTTDANEAEPAAAATGSRSTLDGVVELALRRRGKHEAARTKPDEHGWLARARAGIRSDVAVEWARLTGEHPNWTDEQVADALGPVAGGRPAAGPAAIPSGPDPIDACDLCDANGLVQTGPNHVQRCTHEPAGPRRPATAATGHPGAPASPSPRALRPPGPSGTAEGLAS